jgi:multisubunit Na+/H+ antiporter MnhE subunit
MLTCRQAAESVAEHALKRPSFGSRLLLKLHLALCVACRRVRRQVRTVDACCLAASPKIALFLALKARHTPGEQHAVRGLETRGAPLGRKQYVGISTVAWLGVWAFWLVTSRDFHPSFTLAVLVTTCLVTAYAGAFHVNHLILVPRYWRRGRRVRHLAWLTVMMVLLTAAALAVIRIAYTTWHGPDPDPYGVYKHFAIDLFGMAMHLLAASAVVAGFRRFAPAASRMN